VRKNGGEVTISVEQWNDEEHKQQARLTMALNLNKDF
jgi:hypothetical protein